jgi:hypothetical protein
VKKAFTPHFLAHFDVYKENSQDQKDAHLKMEHNGTKKIENGLGAGEKIDF